MVFEERNAWAGLIVSPIVMVAYVVLVLQNAGEARSPTSIGSRSCCG